MVISSCHLKITNGLKYAPEVISEGLNFKKFSGGHAPDPLEGTLLHTIHLPPQMFSKNYLTTSCPVFWMKHCILQYMI